MNIVVLVSIISLAVTALCGIVFGIVEFFYWRYVSKQEIKKLDNNYYKQLEDKFLEKIRNEHKEFINNINNEEKFLQQRLDNINNEISAKKSFNENLLKIREDELNRLIEEKKKEKIEYLQREVDDWAKSAQEAADLHAEAIQELIQEEIQENRDVLLQIQKEIEDYKTKREIINQEILRSRAIEEKQDFYRIQLDNDSKDDILILNEIKLKLKKSELLNKLIYENYIARPAKEMIKRVLEGKNPSGIYKITNTTTSEIYIGKSVKIADRFLNHIKSACGLEGVAESQFQRALKKYGVDSFVWELLEEVSKEKLTEREKYYIMFYGTKEYGYNQREG